MSAPTSSSGNHGPPAAGTSKPPTGTANSSSHSSGNSSKHSPSRGPRASPPSAHASASPFYSLHARAAASFPAGSADGSAASSDSEVDSSSAPTSTAAAAAAAVAVAPTLLTAVPLAESMDEAATTAEATGSAEDEDSGPPRSLQDFLHSSSLSSEDEARKVAAMATRGANDDGEVEAQGDEEEEEDVEDINATGSSTASASLPPSSSSSVSRSVSGSGSGGGGGSGEGSDGPSRSAVDSPPLDYAAVLAAAGPSSQLTAASDAFLLSSIHGTAPPTTSSRPTPLATNVGGSVADGASTVRSAPPVHGNSSTAASHSSAASGSAAQPAAPFTRLTLSSSSDSLSSALHSASSSSSTDVTAAVSSSSSSSSVLASHVPKGAVRSIFKLLDPRSIFSSSSSTPPLSATAAAGAGTGNPSPPPPPAAASSSPYLSPITPFVAASSSGGVSMSNFSLAAPGAGAHQLLPGSSSAAAGAAPASSPATAPAQKVFTYADFAAKMKQPAAQDIVRMLKAYVKLVQSPEWLAAHTSASETADPTISAAAAALSSIPGLVPILIPSSSASSSSSSSTSLSLSSSTPSPDFVRVRQEYNELLSSVMRLLRGRHPLWRQASEDELDSAAEGVEKFLCSKLYDRFFGLWPAERTADAHLNHRLAVLSTWVTPAHMDLPATLGTPAASADGGGGGGNDHHLGAWEAPAQELRAMARFKAPRDKIVCLLNAAHLISAMLKRAKSKANAEAAEARREKRAAAAAAAAAVIAAASSSAAAAADLTSAVNGPNGSSPSTPAPSDSSPAAVPPTLHLQREPSEGESSSSSATGGGSSGGGGMAPSSSPGADAFFPALLYALIVARVPNLLLQLNFIALCRADNKAQSGEAAYYVSSVASAVTFLQQADHKSFSWPIGTAHGTDQQQQQLPHASSKPPATVACLSNEEARAEFEALMTRGEAMVRTQQQQQQQQQQQSHSDAAAAVSVDGDGHFSADGLSSSDVSFSSNDAPMTHHHHHHHDVSAWRAATSTAPSSPSTSAAATAATCNAPCIACLHLAHRRLSPSFVEREFSSLRVSELEDLVREYKEMVFLIQSWQMHPQHRELLALPVSQQRDRATRAALAQAAHTAATTALQQQYAATDDAEAGVSLPDADAHSAAPSGSALGPPPAAGAAAPQAASSRGWAWGLGIGRAK